MAASAEGFTASAGAEPADRTSTWPPDKWVRNAAAIWDRPALWTQTKSTDGRTEACRAASVESMGPVASTAPVDSVDSVDSGIVVIAHSFGSAFRGPRWPGSAQRQ